MNMNMKINFKKLKDIEKEYENSKLSIDTLNLMLHTVLTFQDNSYRLAPNNVKTAINTLIELDIFLTDENYKPTIQQINS